MCLFCYSKHSEFLPITMQECFYEAYYERNRNFSIFWICILSTPFYVNAGISNVLEDLEYDSTKEEPSGVYEDGIVEFSYNQKTQMQIYAEWNGQTLTYYVKPTGYKNFADFNIKVEVSSYEWFETQTGKSATELKDYYIRLKDYEKDIPMYDITVNETINERVNKFLDTGLYRYIKLYDNQIGSFAVMWMTLPTIEECGYTNELKEIYESWSMSDAWMENKASLDGADAQAFAILNIPQKSSYLIDFAPYADKLYQIAQNIINKNLGTYASYPSFEEKRGDITIICNGKEAEVQTYCVYQGKAYNFDVEFTYETDNGLEFDYNAYYVSMDGRLPYGSRHDIKQKN